MKTPEEQRLELHQQKVDIERKMANIRQEIDTAKRVYAQGGRGMPPEQLGKKERLLRALGADVQTLQMKIGALRRLGHIDRSVQFPELFLEAARELLDPTTVFEISRHANDVIRPKKLAERVGIEGAG